MAPALVTIESGATWEEVAADRQKYRDASIAAVQPPIPDVQADLPLNVSGIPRQLLSSNEIKITELPPEEILSLLASQSVSAKEVVTAFLRRAGLAQKLVLQVYRPRFLYLTNALVKTNCVTELLTSQALSRAASLDLHMQNHGKPVGPLHGLPISVKEHIGMKDLDLNAGFVSWVGMTGQEDAHILQILWEAGAVFYVRTTQPQSLMHLETSSNLYGYIPAISSLSLRLQFLEVTG